MKQFITKEQWEELSVKERHTLTLSVGLRDIEIAWTMFSIGQMIEFLGEGFQYEIFEAGHGGEIYPIWKIKGAMAKWRPDSLCDALWGAVKNKLNNTD